MKKHIQIFAILLITLSFTEGFAQNRYKKPGRHRAPVVIVHPPVYCPPPRPVVHRVWKPAPVRHRWVFFPAQNCYWDTFYNQYAFWNGRMWVSQPMAPPTMRNMNLAHQPQYEINDCDQNDQAFAYNEVHRNRYR